MSNTRVTVVSYDQFVPVINELVGSGGPLFMRRSADADFVRGCRRFGERTGKLTIKQLRVLGRIYKRHLNDGEYIHHEWPIWQQVISRAS